MKESNNRTANVQNFVLLGDHSSVNM